MSKPNQEHSNSEHSNSAHSNSTHPNNRSALLLGGGGARAAYQVGVLKGIAEIIPHGAENPFPIICGTSAGSINTIALASNANNFHYAVERINHVWANFKLGHVFYADGKNLSKRILSWAWANLGFGSTKNGPSSLLDNQPLRHLLNGYISFDNIKKSIKKGDLHAYCVTACSYSTGESTTFFDGHNSIDNWQRTHREGRRATMNIDYLMASSAIPVVFPSVKIDDEYFGDGSMRQISPISPALHLGAEKILIIGLRVEGKAPKPKRMLRHPSLGQISGYVMDTLFLNSLHSDIERMERVNRILKDQSKPDERLRPIEHMVISPSKDIADIATRYYADLPKAFRIALKFLGMSKGNSRRFISYLMFTKRFTQELIQLGYEDAKAQQAELHAFLDL